MRTVQMTLDEELVTAVDRAVKRLGTTRSAFARDALRQALQAHALGRMEARHRRGYELHPVTPGEFDLGDEESSWGDE